MSDSSARTLELPLVIAGELQADSGRGEHTFRYDSGVEVRLPRLTTDHVDTIIGTSVDRERALAELSLFDITTFLAKVGRNWLEDQSDAVKMAREWVPRIVGYPDEMVADDLYMMAEYLRWRSYLYDQVAADLGHELVLDEWIPVQASYMRAFPLGTVVHYLVGNIPLASIYSLIRATATKNVSIAKLARRDPVSGLAFAMACHEVDPDHPVTRALTMVYWEHGDAVADPLLDSAGVVCVWGGRTAVESVRQKAPAHARLLEFGPKWSAAVVDVDQVPDDELAVVAARLVSDVCFYDQEACLSAHRLFVAGDWSRLRPAVVDAMNSFSGRLPLVTDSPDLHAHRRSVLLEWHYAGARIASGLDWNMIEWPHRKGEHPLGRTLFVHEVATLEEVGDHLDRDAQTVAIYPWSAGERVRDTYALAGASRLVELGLSRHARQGYTHDGMRSLNWLVRLVAQERPLRPPHLYKYGDLTLARVEERLFRVEGPSRSGTT
jgi:long-chain-fatty-acyl-CoA reductase